MADFPNYISVLAREKRNEIFRDKYCQIFIRVIFARIFIERMIYFSKNWRIIITIITKKDRLKKQNLPGQPLMSHLSISQELKFAKNCRPNIYRKLHSATNQRSTEIDRISSGRLAVFFVFFFNYKILRHAGVRTVTTMNRKW